MTSLSSIFQSFWKFLVSSILLGMVVIETLMILLLLAQVYEQDKLLDEVRKIDPTFGDKAISSSS